MTRQSIPAGWTPLARRDDPPTSQCSLILAHLRAGNTITPGEAFYLCGTLACHSRITELRKRGHNIVCELVKLPSGKTVGRYSLVKRARKEGQ